MSFALPGSIRGAHVAPASCRHDCHAKRRARPAWLPHQNGGRGRPPDSRRDAGATRCRAISIPPNNFSVVSSAFVTVYARFPIPRMTFFGNIRVFWHLSASAHGEPMQSINSFDFPFLRELSISRVQVRGRWRCDSGCLPMEKHAMKGRKSHRQVLHKIDLDRMLEILSAFDRGMVELSMGLYNVPRRERIRMRQQNRRLHRALRRGMPGLLKAPQPLFELSDSL
jgi:hypothetical protein